MLRSGPRNRVALVSSKCVQLGLWNCSVPCRTVPRSGHLRRAVTPGGVLEAHARDALIDARVDGVELGAKQVGLGIGQLAAGRAADLEQRAAHAVRGFGRGEA